MSPPAVAVEPISDLDRHRAEWTALAPGAGHPFATWEWNSIWWRHFGAGRELYSFLCRDEAGAVTAILPMYVAQRHPVGVARFLGYADLQSPVCAAEHRELAAQALATVLRRPYRCRAAFAERLPGDQGWAPLLGGSVVNTFECPVLMFDGRGWDEILGGLSRKHRGNLRRAEQAAREKHGLSLRLADDPDRLADDMRSLFRLHDLRFGSHTTGVFGGAGADFHLECAAAALAGGWLRLWLAEIDGEAVAAWYGFRFAGMDWHLQGGRDPRFNKVSAGTVLWLHTIREACADGQRGYSFLAGDDAYKLRLATGDQGAESRVIGSRALVAAVAGGVKLRQRTAAITARSRRD